MRGLPPVPATVARWTWHCSLDAQPWSVGFWLWMTGLQDLTLPQLDEFHASIAVFALEFHSRITTRASSISASTVRRPAPQPFESFIPMTANAGVLEGAQALNTALSVYWGTSDAGKRGHTITRLAGLADFMTDDHRLISIGGRELVRAAALDFLANMTIGEPGDPFHCRLVTLRRIAAGAPAAESSIALIDHVRAVRHVGRQDVRLRVGS